MTDVRFIPGYRDGCGVAIALEGLKAARIQIAPKTHLSGGEELSEDVVLG